MTKLEKARAVLNERFRKILPQRFHEKFGVEIKTSWSMLEMAVVTSRTNGKALTTEQQAFVAAFEDGYAQALVVLDELIAGGR